MSRETVGRHVARHLAIGELAVYGAFLVAGKKIPGEWVRNFMRRVMVKTGCDTTAELARALGLIAPSDIRQLHNWVTGGSAPDFENTLYILREAGLLTDADLAADIPTSENRVSAWFGRNN